MEICEGAEDLRILQDRTCLQGFAVDEGTRDMDSTFSVCELWSKLLTEHLSCRLSSPLTRISCTPSALPFHAVGVLVAHAKERIQLCTETQWRWVKGAACLQAGSRPRISRHDVHVGL